MNQKVSLPTFDSRFSASLSLFRLHLARSLRSRVPSPFVPLGWRRESRKGRSASASSLLQQSSAASCRRQLNFAGLQIASPPFQFGAKLQLRFPADKTTFRAPAAAVEWHLFAHERAGGRETCRAKNSTSTATKRRDHTISSLLQFSASASLLLSANSRPTCSRGIGASDKFSPIDSRT